MNVEPSNYERPEVDDLGTLAEITLASGFVNEEDGGSKLLIHHTSPASQPTGP